MPLPNGVSQPLQSITDTDQSGLVAVLAAFALALLLISVPIRICIRGRLGRYGCDDYSFFAAVVSLPHAYPWRCTHMWKLLGIVQATLVFLELSKGMGKAEKLLNPNDELDREKVRRHIPVALYLILTTSRLHTRPRFYTSPRNSSANAPLRSFSFVLHLDTTISLLFGRQLVCLQHGWSLLYSW